MKRNVALAIFLMSFVCCHFLYAQTEFVLREDAKRISKSCFTVTLDQLERKGAIWWPNKVDLTKDLELNFVVYLGDKDGGGADGIGFVFHNDPRGFDAKGSPAGGLYFGDHPDRGDNSKIVPSVAIEMDTYSNPQCSPRDPSYDHTAIVYNGDMCNPKLPSTRLHKTKDNVEDNTCYKSVIKWNASSKTLQLYFMEKDNPVPELVFSYTDDLVNNVFGGNGNVYYGFTGSTGGAGNDQTICIFEGNTAPTAKNDYASTAFGVAVDVDVQANDFDADGDPLFTTEIVTPPKHGTANILNYKNKIHYDPTVGYSGLDSLEYRVCDLDPGSGAEKCYYNCSNAWVIINKVGCPTYVLKATDTKDNEKCDPAKPDNGAARAFMWDGTNEITTDFTFKWYNGSFATPAQVVALTPAYTGVSIGNLADGTYTVWAEYALNTTCKAPNVVPVVIKKDITNTPAFTIALNKSVTNCSPGNGEVQVNFTDPTAKPSDYSIAWYEIYPAKIFTGQIFNKAEAKTYTVEVTNLASGCSSIGTINVPKSYTSPVITRISTPRKSCSVMDGSLSASVAGNTSNYEFRWSVSNDKKILNPFIGPVYSGLDSGNYWLNVRDKVTGCYYDTLLVRVNDSRVMPVISVVKTPQSSCDPSKPNGTITASVTNSGVGDTYTYQWYEGNNTVNPLTAPSTSSGNVASKLRALDYTVVVTNNSTGCSTVKKGITIVEDKDAPVVKILLKQDPTKCSPGDGKITVEVDPDGAGPRPSPDNTYTFNWWKGASVKATAPDYTGDAITGLISGQYTVQATSSNGCQANTTVILNPVPASTFPTIVMTPSDDNSCDPTKPNGKIVSTVTGGSGSYSYNWFKGGSLLDPLSAFNDMPTATGLSVDTYTLMITDKITGCTKIEYADVNFIIIPPYAVNAVKNLDVLCQSALTGPNGSVSASVGGDVTNYDFNWYAGSVVKGTPDFTGTTWNGLGAGDYTVVALHKTNHCESSSSTVTLNNVDPFTISIVINTPSAGCLTPSGTLKAKAGPTGSYTYDWFQGVPDMPLYPYFSYPAYALNSDIITNLAPSKYTVRVTDNLSKCAVYKIEDLTSSSPMPEVYLKAPVDNTSCALANGELEIDYIVPDPISAPGNKIYPNAITGFPAGYEIYWINGPNRPVTLTGATTYHKYKNLTAGSYVVVVKVPANTCESLQVPGVIKDNPNRMPVITINKVDQTYCNPFNGSITVNITNYTGNPNDYSAVIKRNAVVLPIASFPAIANPWNLTALQNGVYSIIITNTVTNCTTSKVVIISDHHVNPTRHLSISAENASCSATGSGLIEIIGPNLVKEKYNWFRNDNTPIGDPAGNDVAISSLEAGGYYVIVTNRISGCTYKESASVNDAQVLPAIVVQSTTPRTRCSTIDGTATINLGPNANYTYYNLSWTLPYPSAPVPTVAVGSSPNQFVASNLDTGTYIITATDPVMTCFTSTPFKIGLQQSMPVVDLNFTDVTACVPNGSITANITSGTALYDVTLKDLNTGALTVKSSVPASPSPLFSSLLPGEYLATVVDSRGCTSLPTQITVSNKMVKPKLQIVALKHNSSCTSTPNGMIMVTSAPKNNFKYTWTSLTAGGSFLQTAGNDTTITEVKGGRYRIKVKDQSVGSICMDSLDITLRDTIISFTPLISKLDVTRCSYPYDGALIASVSGASAYTFVWTNLDSANKKYIGQEFSNLPPANYTLDVTHIVSNCSVHIPVTLAFNPVPLHVTLTEDAPQSNCDPLKPNAQWTTSVEGQISGYTFEWYEGNSIASGKLHYKGTTSAKMKATEYTLRVKDIIRGCIKDTTITPSNRIMAIAAPDIDSLKHLTSCITPNGYASVSVDGNTSDYVFNWYKGSQGSAPVGNPGNQPKGPDYKGYEQTGLDVGNYTVYASSVLTGCISNPTVIAIKDNKIYPEFNFSTKNSLCSQSNGALSISWVEPVKVNTIEITNGKMLLGDAECTDMPSGEFNVTLTSPEGCSFSKTVTVGADFMVYNGISPNGDGKNDQLEIDCIELFPKNVVKIYNRSGLLVYEGSGYDNKMVYFSGYGNKGIYPAGSYLPDGTYYYIVDIGNGGKPKAGFFELLR